MPRINNRIFCLWAVLIISLLTFCLPVHAAGKKDFVVVIDAGHGGKDTGAIDNNAKEKDINLGVAQYLAEYLKKKKGFKVVMTRDGDKFIGLNDRAAKANKEKADLFISIHTNSLDANNPNRKNVEGATTYVLGLHRDADNLAVARRENSVIAQEKNHEERYEGFDPDKDESYIVFEMAQKKNLSNSIGFAQEVQKELVKTAGRRDRGVHQAGFLVLRETAMPAVLVEVDFICNPNSARYINSSTGQKKLARGIADAVVTYRDRLKKNDKAYADLSLDAKADEGGDVFVLSSGGTDRTSRKSVTSGPATGKQRVSGPRKRRSASSRQASSQQNYETEYIALHTENVGRTVTRVATPRATTVSEETEPADSSSSKSSKASKEKISKKEKQKKEKQKNNKKEDKEENVRIVNNHRVVVSSTPAVSNPRSLKSSKPTRSRGTEPEPEQVAGEVATAFGVSTDDEVAEELYDGQEQYDEEAAVPAESAQARRRSGEPKSVKKTSKQTESVNASREVARPSEKAQKTVSEEQTASKSAKKQEELMKQQASQDIDANNRSYEEAKQRQKDNYQTSSAPRSLKSKKK